MEYVIMSSRTYPYKNREAAMQIETLESIQNTYDTDINLGLTRGEAARRLERYGENRLKTTEPATFFSLFAKQFKNVLIVILLIAAFISLFIGEMTEGVVILSIVVLNAYVGARQEKSAGDAVKALRNLAAPNARVLREGEPLEIPSLLLVPGDLVILEAGDLVPADLILTESVNLKIEESALTGESVPVEKDAGYTVSPEAPIGERTDSAFVGTVVTYGRGRGIVAKTGMATEIGKIANLLDQGEEATPLQKKLNDLGGKLGTVCLLVSGLIFAMGLYRGMALMEIFMVAISLAVAAVPEGLPAIVTVILALGMKRMVRRHVLVKQLGSVETLGSTTVICSDKTGTLTQNAMAVVRLFDGDNLCRVTGSGYQTLGEVQGNCSKTKLKDMILAAMLCNDAVLGSQDNIMGDPTEAALLIMGIKAGFPLVSTRESYPRLDEYPFDSHRKMMSTLHEIDGELTLLTKGAPDSLFKICSWIEIDGKPQPLENHIQTLEKIYADWASEALRVLCYAKKSVSPGADITLEEQEMTFVGMSGMIDPPRPEAAKAITTCREAGIRVIMITGDHALTAAAIGREIGLLTEGDTAVTGAEIDTLKEEEFLEKLKVTHVFSRVSPEHKVTIVDGLKQLGHIVGMTGDGVNDAPSLKRADIGIAMGITGTDVSKEASDMILTDDNFASIVGAVEEGRVIYSNIRKFVSFLISCNIGEILLIFVAMLLGWGSPLKPIQLLWVNLITDSLPAFALGLEPEEDSVMKAQPRDPDQPIVDRKMGIGIVFQSLGLATAALLSYRYGYRIDPEMANTFAFLTLISGELLRAFSGRSESQSVFKTGFF